MVLPYLPGVNGLVSLYIIQNTTKWLKINLNKSKQIIGHFAVNNFFFLQENCSILNWISMTTVPNGLIDCVTALFQSMAWRRTGNKPFSEPMHESLTIVVVYDSVGFDELTQEYYPW